MDSPIKPVKLNLAGKENAFYDATHPKEEEVKVESVKPAAETKEAEKPVVLTGKDLDADEPLLQENPNRFVLFPIKYHEVSILPFPPVSVPTRRVSKRVKWVRPRRTTPR